MQLISKQKLFYIVCVLYIANMHVPCHAITLPAIEKKHMIGMAMGIIGLAIMGYAYKWYRNQANNNNNPVGIYRLPIEESWPPSKYDARAHDYRLNNIF